MILIELKEQSKIKRIIGNNALKEQMNGDRKQVQICQNIKQ